MFVNNKNNSTKNIGGPSSFGNLLPAIPTAHVQSQSQGLQQMYTEFPRSFRLSQLSATNGQGINSPSTIPIAYLQSQSQGQQMLAGFPGSFQLSQLSATHAQGINLPQANLIAYLQSQSQGQQQMPPGFPGSLQLFQLSAAHAQAINLPRTNPIAHIQPQSQDQQQMPPGFPGSFQLSAAHAQAIAQAQLKDPAQAQAEHARFQAQLQAQHLSLSQAHGLGNVGSSSPSMPGSSSAKRLPQKPLVRPPAFTTTNMISPMRTKQLSAASRKKKQKLPEKHLHEKVAAILPESALYTQLLEFESRVDSALARKKVDIQESLKNPPTTQKTLRIYVFNTFANQVMTIPKKPKDEPPLWTLKIVGRILEEGMDAEQAAMFQKSSPMYPKFSTFFKRVTISLDHKLYPDNHLIIWDSARSPAPQDGFEVKRKGEEEFTVNLGLELNYMPEKYKLSPALTEVLGIDVETRVRIISSLWHYVKVQKLQNPDDPSYFNCDSPLQKVFGEGKVKFDTVAQKITPHLSPPQPIHLEHRIKLSGNNPAGIDACYDVMVDVPFPIQRELNALLANTEETKEIQACEEAIVSDIRKIHEHRRRRAHFLGFSQSPVEFIDAVLESQSKDLKVGAEESRSAEKESRSPFYSQPWYLLILCLLLLNFTCPFFILNCVLGS
ncbi:SWI/SNF complex component SNF12 -like protein [Capsicum annuum]|uniref:SWI/SNF complex component SNF12 -like protein n=1 Tax=Capsicum annuum TaxID=4072 RepID=A0A2G3A6B4_CAPAN|nr:SWI/SNF complex component SNF12 -like protein [Capsicum annuum]